MVPRLWSRTPARAASMVCGYHVNQATLAPKGYLTGAEWNWEALYPRFVKMFTAGETIPNFVPRRPQGRLGQGLALRRDGVGSRPQAGRRVKAKLTDGSFVIFKGPLMDNKGKTVIAGGHQSRSDRSRAGEDGLPGRRRDRRDFVKADVPICALDQSDKLIAGGAARADRRRRRDRGNPGARTCGGAGAVRDLRRAVRQEPARSLFLHVPGRVRHAGSPGRTR